MPSLHSSGACSHAIAAPVALVANETIPGQEFAKAELNPFSPTPICNQHKYLLHDHYSSVPLDNVNDSFDYHCRVMASDRESPAKRRRLHNDSSPDSRRPYESDTDASLLYDHFSPQSKQVKDDSHYGPVSSGSKHATKAVASFLSEHIPQQYAPQGDDPNYTTDAAASMDSDTRYCYRHRPDLKCRRKVDEDGMDHLQQVRSPLPGLFATRP